MDSCPSVYTTHTGENAREHRYHDFSAGGTTPLLIRGGIIRVALEGDYHNGVEISLFVKGIYDGWYTRAGYENNLSWRNPKDNVKLNRFAMLHRDLLKPCEMAFYLEEDDFYEALLHLLRDLLQRLLSIQF